MNQLTNNDAALHYGNWGLLGTKCQAVNHRPASSNSLPKPALQYFYAESRLNSCVTLKGSLIMTTPKRIITKLCTSLQYREAFKQVSTLVSVKRFTVWFYSHRFHQARKQK